MRCGWPPSGGVDFTLVLRLRILDLGGGGLVGGVGGLPARQQRRVVEFDQHLPLAEGFTLAPGDEAHAPGHLRGELDGLERCHGAGD